MIGYLVVIFHLIGDLGHARAGDGAHIVIPPVDAFTRFAVIRRPAKIGRVDVGGQPFFKPVQLVGADEMHFAGETGLVARAAQVMGKGRDGGGELGGIVINARARRQLPCHEAGPARRAERRGGIGVLEPGGARGKPLEVGRVQPVGGAVREERAVELVDHDDQDVGFGHGTLLLLRGLYFGG